MGESCSVCSLLNTSCAMARFHHLNPMTEVYMALKFSLNAIQDSVSYALLLSVLFSSMLTAYTMKSNRDHVPWLLPPAPPYMSRILQLEQGLDSIIKFIHKIQHHLLWSWVLYETAYTWSNCKIRRVIIKPGSFPGTVLCWRSSSGFPLFFLSDWNVSAGLRQNGVPGQRLHCPVDYSLFTYTPVHREAFMFQKESYLGG